MITIRETFNYNVCRSYHQTQYCQIRCDSFHCHQICYQNTAQSDVLAFTAINSATNEYCAVAFSGYGSAKYNAATSFATKSTTVESYAVAAFLSAKSATTKSDSAE